MTRQMANSNNYAKWTKSQLLERIKELEAGGRVSKSDMLEREHNEKALEQSEAKLKDILNSSPIGLSIVSHNTGERIYANPKFNHMFSGTSGRQLDNKNIAETFVDLDNLNELHRINLETNFEHEAVVLRKRLDGTSWWCLQSWRPISSWGTGVHMVWHYDISERKRAEEALAKQIAIMDAVFESMDQGVVMYDKNMSVAAFNEQARRLMRFPEDVLFLGNSFKDINKFVKSRGDPGTGDTEAQTEERFKIIEEGAPHSLEYVHSDGAVVDIRRCAVLGGGFVVTQTDVTERKNAEDRIARAHDLITDSIDYAGKIQRSILPDVSIFEAQFEDHFILWEPRDIVGGDIYCCKSWGEGLVVMLGDCTGHGVPGAFVTMIATGALDRALSETSEGDVSDVLQRMHRLICKMLGQDNGTSESNDGLELGMCYITPDYNRLIFAGARFDLFSALDGVVERYRGTRCGIGYPEVPLDQEFEEICLEINATTSFYMTTDGLIDQIGKSSQQRFGTKRFQTFLNDVQNTNMDSQKGILLKMSTEHRGSEPRFDDMAVIGFRFGSR